MILLHKLPRPKTMDDAVSPSAIPADAKLVAGYVDGNFADYGAIAARFAGKADLVSICIFLDSLADFADVEPGNPIKTPAQVRASFEFRKAHGVWNPGFYGDHARMTGTIIPGLAGIPRSQYRLWLADWTDREHIPPGYDACQYESLSSPNIDVSEVAASFFPPNTTPKAKSGKNPLKKVLPVVKKIHPKVKAAAPGGGIGAGVATALTHAGVHLTSAEAAAVGALFALLAAYFTKGATTP